MNIKIEDVYSISQTSQRECDTNSYYNNKSKLCLKNAIIYLERLPLKNDLVARESYRTISHATIRIREDLFDSTIGMLDNKTFVETEELLIKDEEPDEESQFHEVKDDDSDKYISPNELEDDDSDKYIPLEEENKLMEYIPLEYKIKVVNMAKKHPKWSLKTLQRKGCSHLKSMKHLQRWEEHIKRGGTTIDKYTIINSRTYDRFVEARTNHQQVTTRNLQQWALSAASQFHDFPFKASHSWVTRFKKQHKIRQRKQKKLPQ